MAETDETVYTVQIAEDDGVWRDVGTVVASRRTKRRTVARKALAQLEQGALRVDAARFNSHGGELRILDSNASRAFPIGRTEQLVVL